MNILILGASGFIGNSIFNSLIGKHALYTAGRKPIDGLKNWKYMDFSSPNNWESLLDEIDLVINAIGILEGDFSKIQTESPISLYKVCMLRKIKIIHISAVGAELDLPPTDFLISKKNTDDFLLSYEQAKVVYPGIVIGRNGKSSQFLTEISRLPVIPIFGKSKPPFVAISQLTQFIEDIVNDFNTFPRKVFCVSEPESFQNIFTALKGKKARFITLPISLLKVFFIIFPYAKIGMFTKSLLAMLYSLSASNYWNNEDNYNILLLKRNSESLNIIKPTSRCIEAKNMIASNSLPYLFALLAISYIWIWSAISSLVSWDLSYSIMQEVGANHLFSVASIYLGSLVDVILGVAIFNKRYRNYILLLQIIFISVYSILLSILAPHYWLHPFGVLAKNIPLVALSYYVYLRKE